VVEWTGQRGQPVVFGKRKSREVAT
jgi:hypothetical protein